MLEIISTRIIKLFAHSCLAKDRMSYFMLRSLSVFFSHIKNTTTLLVLAKLSWMRVMSQLVRDLWTFGFLLGLCVLLAN